MSTGPSQITSGCTQGIVRTGYMRSLKRRAFKEKTEFGWMGRHASILHHWPRKHKHRAEVDTTNTLSLINTNAVNITEGTQEKE